MASTRLASNALWNLGGMLFPIVVALLCIPYLIAQIGLARFGFLTLAWALAGYASMFDFGLGYAVTRLAAARIGQGDEEGARSVARNGAILLGGLGLVIGLALAAASGWLVHDWLNVAPGLQAEALRALWVLSVSMPFVLLATAYRATLEAWQAFRPLNLVRSATGLLSYLGPMAVAAIDPRLDWVLAALLVSRVAGTALLARASLPLCGRVRPWGRLQGQLVQELLRLGGWGSVSALINPLTTYLDRFLLGGFVSVATVAYYTTPQDMVGRALLLPYAVMATILPVLSAQGRSAESDATYAATVRLLMVVMFPVCFSVVALAHPLLALWLGPAFAVHGAPVLQILALGLLANSLAQAPAYLIQGTGNPKWMALMNLSLVPPYLVALWFAVRHYGIVGAAACWSGRMLVDAAMLYIFTGYRLCNPALGTRWYLAALAGCALLLASALPERTALSVAVWLAGMAGFVPVSWFCLLNARDRMLIGGMLRRTEVAT